MSTEPAPASPATVSVVIPTYNVAASIERAIRSAQAQTAPPLEILVIDDASTDNTREIVREMMAADPHIRLLESAVNAGPSRARNRGIEAATGDYIAILDGDDAWRPERLARMTAAMRENGVQFVADNLVLYDIWADREGRLAYLTSQSLTHVDAPVYFANCVREKFQFSLLKPLISRQFLLDHQIRYRDDVRYGEDFFLYADIFLAGARGLVLAEGWYVYTTQVGEFSGRQSPQTRSTADFRPIVARLRELLPMADAATRKQMRRCITSFEATRKGDAARALRREGRYLAYACAIADPDILAQMVKMRLRRLRLKLAGQV